MVGAFTLLHNPQGHDPSARPLNTNAPRPVKVPLVNFAVGSNPSCRRSLPSSSAASSSGHSQRERTGIVQTHPHRCPPPPTSLGEIVQQAALLKVREEPHARAAHLSSVGRLHNCRRPPPARAQGAVVAVRSRRRDAPFCGPYGNSTSETHCGEQAAISLLY
jgi:hypothetical protein